MFAEISFKKQVLFINVIKKNPVNDEFSDFVDECEKLYTSLCQPFILVFDLSFMGLIGPVEVYQWMTLFFKVKHITEQYLKCTVVCMNDNLREPVNMFLKLYNPIKPFHVLYDSNYLTQFVTDRRIEFKLL